MKYEKDYKKIKTVKIRLNENRYQSAKSFAKKHGYSFQDWLGCLVEDELKQNEVK